MEEKKWDIFISHASEDKVTVARPLAAALRRAGVRVWLDEHELRVGDSLSEKVDEGLSQSRFGVVILSPGFFAKRKYSVIPWVGLAPRPGVRWRLGRLDGPGWLWRARRGWWR